MDKVYLAGSCGSESRTIMKGIANQLREMGVEVYCPFELKIPNAWDMCQEEWARKVFDKDIAAIRDCDVFVMITPGRASTAGTNFEQGFAYALGKRIIVIQYTDSNTSLMTYCGATAFANVDENDMIYHFKDCLVKAMKNSLINVCETILT